MSIDVDAVRARAREWMQSDPDPHTSEELDRLLRTHADVEVMDRFSGELEFGTAGLRGVIGAGPNRMNRAVVRRTTQGLATYLLAHVPDVKTRGVVIGRDGRRLSPELAEDTACVLAANGIPALVFPGVVPTPVAAFAVLDRKAAAGVMVTASHNPPEYNGYKVYWGNGAQIVPPHDGGIAAAIAKVGAANQIALLSVADAKAKGLWKDLGDDVGERYIARILEERIYRKSSSSLRFVYTAMHGVGGRWVEKAFAAAKCGTLLPVAEQHEPDAAFPTVRFPNPEEPGALDLSLELAQREGVDIILANDPDADRLAVAARQADGAMKPLTGNEVGVLMGHFLLTQKKADKPLVLTTIVSSPQLGRIASDLGARYEETLTGFKWIANRSMAVEAREGATFLFGYEEALGYTVGTVARDKDGVGSALVFADMVAWLASQKKTVWNYLEEVQRKHGLYLGAQKSLTLPGSEGAKQIAAIMDNFRKTPPSKIGGLKVESVKDYRHDGSDPNRLPSSNVLAYLLEGGSRVTLRPSGTEPKIKYYFDLRESLQDGEAIDAARNRAQTRLAELQDRFVELAVERGQPD